MIHFRWATQGSVCSRNCHPFVQGDVAFGHNGCLPVYPHGDRTDSEEAFMRYIYPAIKKYGLHSKQVDEVVGLIIGSSKFCLMQDYDVRLFGDFIELAGVKYSNLHWQSRLPRSISVNAADYAFRKYVY